MLFVLNVEAKKLEGRHCYTKYGNVQRYVCRDYGYRFSEKSLNESDDPEGSQIIHRMTLNTHPHLLFDRQICVTKTKGMKNLAEVESQLKKQVAGTTNDTKSKIFQIAWQLKKEGYSESTIRNYTKFLTLLSKRGGKLDDTESIKETIAEQKNWNNSTKSLAVAAYTYYCSINEIKWQIPKYKPTRQLPFIPLESEIDQLIASSGKKRATTLQLLKETGMRIGELCQLKGINIDLERNTITVNNPEKGSLPRRFKISLKLASMINALPRKNDRIFGKQNPRYAASSLCILRKNVSRKLKDPRFNQIHFHTLRHWKATTEYHRTKDILHVMKMLGHRRIENTLIYTQLIQDGKDDDYHSATAKTVEDAQSLIETGFEYICTCQDIMLFRKRK